MSGSVGLSDYVSGGRDLAVKARAQGWTSRDGDQKTGTFTEEKQYHLPSERCCFKNENCKPDGSTNMIRNGMRPDATA